MPNLLKLSLVALVAATSAVVSAEAVVRLAPHAPQFRAAWARTPAGLQAGQMGISAGGAVVRGEDGHYWAIGVVNGAPVRFLVDTGATAVALTPADAARLGFQPQDLQYGSRVVTAGGQTRAAPVKLASITVAGAELRDVEGLVIEKGLDTSLLGMSYLGRLRRFEASREGIVLTP